MSCLNVWMTFLVWQWYNMLNTSLGIILLMLIYHSLPPFMHLPYLPPPSLPFLCCRCSRRSSTGRSMCGSSSAGTPTTGSRSKTRLSTAQWRTWQRPWRDMWPPRLSCWILRPSAASPTWWEHKKKQKRYHLSHCCYDSVKEILSHLWRWSVTGNCNNQWNMKQALMWSCNCSITSHNFVIKVKRAMKNASLRCNASV